MKNIQGIKRAYTHAGVFHGDDVFSTALIELLNPEIEIIRTAKPAEPESDEVLYFDLGFGRFDHHQKDGRVRANGVKYAALGLLWEEFGPQFVPNEFVQLLDEQFVQSLDRSDNGGEPDTLYRAISTLNPNWDENGDFDEQFRIAVEMAQLILERLFAQCWAKKNAQQEVFRAVDSAIEKGLPAVVLDRYLPWQEALFEHPANEQFDYIIFPSVRGGYQIQAIPSVANGRDQRSPFPEEWVAQRPEKATFVHPGRFLVGCKTLEDAMLLVAELTPQIK